MTSVNLGKTPIILRSKEAYGVKISQSIVKKYFFVFLYLEKYYTSKKKNKSLN